MIGIISYLGLIFLIVLFYISKRLSLFAPLSIVVFFNFVLPFIFYPFVRIIASGWNSFFSNYLSDNGEALFNVFVIFLFWSIGIGWSVSKERINYDRSVFKYRHLPFAHGIIIIGLSLYFLTFYLSGVNFFSAFSDPLTTRYQIINTTGGFYLRNFGLWFIWTGWFILLILKLSGHSYSLLKLVFLFVFFIVICLPLGQRYQVVYPFIFLLLLLKYRGIIKARVIIYFFVISLFVLPILGLYRELGRSNDGFSAGSLIASIVELGSDNNATLMVLAERFESLKWYSEFLAVKDNLSMSIGDSFSSLSSQFLPVSLTNGVKSDDIEVYLTKKIVGSQEFGTFSFTSFPEWYLNFGYFGLPLMAFLSGLIVRNITNTVRKMGDSIFYLALYADGFFLKIAFININFISNINLLYHLICALILLMLWLFYEQIFFTYSTKKNINLVP